MTRTNKLHMCWAAYRTRGTQISISMNPRFKTFSSLTLIAKTIFKKAIYFSVVFALTFIISIVKISRFVYVKMPARIRTTKRLLKSYIKQKHTAHTIRLLLKL